nr:immunoglobulin light chain junction region [Macaca mulatta]MPO05551.1 immunoglobulin light chain junction region [Macaca mulatta]MPO10599.1 immunoglobulin light chain junction region [Macaca mulatta]
CMIWHNNVYIV